jgi:hypothetical protein
MHPFDPRNSQLQIAQIPAQIAPPPNIAPTAHLDAVQLLPQLGHLLVAHLGDLGHLYVEVAPEGGVLRRAVVDRGQLVAL